MNPKQIIIAAGAFIGALLLFGLKPKAAAAGASSESVAAGGVDYWYASGAAQENGVSQAVVDAWKRDFEALDRTQPDWWV